MLTQEDIQNLIQAQKDVFATKEEFQSFRDEYRKDFSDLQISVDSYAKRANDYFEEMVALSHRLDRHEKWIQQLAQKLDIKLDF